MNRYLALLFGLAGLLLVGWYGYRASKAALNMMIRNLAIEWSRKNDRSIIVALHPGTVDTELSQPFQAHQKVRRE